MYGTDDVVRSVRRLVIGMLGPPWTIDLERREVRDDQRPAGLLESGLHTVRTARAAISQGNVTTVLPLTLTLYPSLDVPRLSGRTARQLATALQELATFGVEGPTFADGRPACGPDRWPLWDWADVPLDGPPADRTGPAHAHDVLWLEDHTTRPIQDPIDPERWAVVLEARVSWEQPGRVGPGANGPMTQRMPGGPVLP